jgi:N-methylhydantoinase B
MQYMRLPAGGGYGDPLDRVAESLVTDVADGQVTPRYATEIYGVVFTAEGTVDEAATTGLRAELRAGRLGVEVAKLRPRADVPRTRFRVTEYLQQTDAGETQCTSCGLVVAPKGSPWKEAAVQRLSPTTIAGPARESAAEFSLLESFCPGCAALLDVEVTNGEDPALHDEIWNWPQP